MPLPSKPIVPLERKDVLRFWEKVIKLGRDDCWEWRASKFPNGYGRFMHGKRVLKSNRVAYAIANRIDPASVGDDILVCHSCDNPPCCNPRHLYLDSHEGNQKRKVRLGRQKAGEGERNSHAKLTDKDILEIRASDETTIELAEKYGINQTGISNIQLGKTWRHVGGRIRDRRPNFGGR